MKCTVLSGVLYLVLLLLQLKILHIILTGRSLSTRKAGNYKTLIELICQDCIEILIEHFHFSKLISSKVI